MGLGGLALPKRNPGLHSIRTRATGRLCAVRGLRMKVTGAQKQSLSTACAIAQSATKPAELSRSVSPRWGEVASPRAGTSGSAGAVRATTVYMAPEQFAGYPVTSAPVSSGSASRCLAGASVRSSEEAHGDSRRRGARCLAAALAADAAGAVAIELEAWLLVGGCVSPRRRRRPSVGCARAPVAWSTSAPGPVADRCGVRCTAR